MRSPFCLKLSEAHQKRMFIPLILQVPHPISYLVNQREAWVNAQKLHHHNCMVNAFNKKSLIKLMFLRAFYFIFHFRLVNTFFVPVEVLLSSVKGGLFFFLNKVITLAQILCTNAGVSL